MPSLLRRSTVRAIGSAAVAALATIAMAIPASAHTPVQLDARDVVPWQGPLILDGENPVMLFGTLPTARSVRSAQLSMRSGQTLSVTLAVPDVAPENQFPLSSMPCLVIVAPDHTVTRLTAVTKQSIETETGPLVALAQYNATAVAGVYSISVTGPVPERFAVGTGVEGEPFAGVKRGRAATDAEVAAWYATPPPAA